MADIQRIAEKVAYIVKLFEAAAADREDDMTDRENEIERAAYQDCAGFLRDTMKPLLSEKDAAQ